MYGNYTTAYPKKPENRENEENVPNEFCYDIVDAPNFARYLKNFRIVIVKAWAPWCQPCKIAGKKLEMLAQQYQEYFKKNHIVFLTDNIDKENSIHRKKVEVVPTFFIYVIGKLNSVFTGVEFEEFGAKIKEVLNNPNAPPSSIPIQKKNNQNLY